MVTRRVAVAASGGRDSTALLHCTLRSAAALGVEVLALHVHHGLNAGADDWLAHVRAQSRRWGAGFAWRRLATQPGPGASVEAWARRERYRALAEMACEAGCGLVLLAHHRRDQAETWLLQALRSGGPAGLSAMPGLAQRAGLVWARPWLDQPRQAIEAYVRRHRLSATEDPSNADPRYARNRLRLQVWPALLQAFPEAEAALVGAAAQAQGAAALAAEVAELDLPALQHGDALRVAPWLALPPARRRNALRAWLAQALARGSPETLIERLSNELPGCRAAQWSAPGATLRLYRGMLSASRTDSAGRVADATTPTPPLPLPLPTDLGTPGRWAMAGWGGSFKVEPTLHGGVEPALLLGAEPRARAGGERFRLAPGGVARSLKKQYQARRVPAWQRQGPLLYGASGQLLFVPGLGIEGAAWALPGQAQLSLVWVPDAPAASGSMPSAGTSAGTSAG